MTEASRLPDANLGALSPDGYFYWVSAQWKAVHRVGG
jgi:hypothetical protein